MTNACPSCNASIPYGTRICPDCIWERENADTFSRDDVEEQS